MVLVRRSKLEFALKLYLTSVIFVLYLTYNLDHNILELYNILVQIRFTISKTEFDIQYSKLGMRVASRVAEQLKS